MSTPLPKLSPTLDPGGRVQERRENLLRALRYREQSAILVTNPVHVHYLSTFRGEDASILLTNDRCILISDGRFVPEIADECPGQESFIKSIEQTAVGAIAEVLRMSGERAVAFEKASMTVAVLESIKENVKGVELVGEEGLVEGLRQIKDDAEIAEIRLAVGYAERAFLKLRKTIKPGDSEKMIARTLESFLRDEGASEPSFPTIVAASPRSSLPHARATDAVLGENDFLLVDWGAAASPYKSDLTRLLATGMVTSKFERIYRIVLEAQLRGIAAIRPGATGNEIDAEARSVIEEAGFGSFFRHGAGHGIGLEIHESPGLRKGSAAVLQAGMVVTVEPGIYLPDWGGIRIEDDILVTPDGHEVLGSLPKSLDSVRLDAR